MSTAAKYLYAIVPANPELLDMPLGIQDQPLGVLIHKKVMLIISDLAQHKIRPERKNLAAHQTVLSHLIHNYPSLLPMQFGMIAANTSTAKKILTQHYASINEKLLELAGKIEMELKVSWDVPNVFDYLIAQHAVLQEARDKLLNKASHLVTRDEKIEIGVLVSQILEKERVEHTETIKSMLSNSCDDIIQNPCRNEKEIMNLACLVSRKKQADFDSKIDELAQFLDDNFLIKYTGPWPPHNFSRLNL
ncbi:MAG: hypothetical protein A3F46_02605 [Legionellales bacterium RIFCSPHIGHO2_12_FULL_42_9]|nr:MAG: hypothetical protein A3F46_02605 [Legionellales bacterium RIFCSPHIGHO2_12_FULL_42_9]